MRCTRTMGVYNRYDAMKLMGFDEFICQSTFLTNTPSYGVWPCDSSLYDETFDVLNETAGSDFCYLATMESHGSYNYDMEHGDWFINDFSSESEQYLNTYFNVLSDADKALGEFLDKLSNWDEPTVVLFFGDHIPSLGEKTYQEIAFDTASPEGFMTPYFIWSNYGLTVKHENMPIQRLGAHTLTQLGLNSDPYLSLIEHTAAGSDEAQIASDLLAYDLLYGKQHYLEITGQDLSNPNYRIGHEVELESAEVFQIEGTLFIVPNGRNLSICSDLVINDHAYPLSNSGLGWRAAVPVDALPADGAEFQIAVRIRDSKDTVISQSNEISVVIDQETAKQAGDAKKQGLENSLIIDSIYPGTEITSEMLKPDGSLDIGVSSPEIAATTVIYADGVELHTFYGDTFISATIPAEMMLDGTVEVQLFNRILQKYSDAVVLQVWHE